MVAMRSGEWKMLSKLTIDEGYLERFQNVHDGNEEMVKQATLVDFELYNIQNDPTESQELSQEHPEVFEDMKAQLQLQYQELLDDSPVWTRTKENE